MWNFRAVARLPAGVQAPAPPFAAGSYSSVVVRELLFAFVALVPPTTNTFPFRRSVAVWYSRAVVRPSVGGPQFPLPPFAAGSSSSALVRMPELPEPPTTRTLPFGRSVAACQYRPVVRLPAGDHVPCTNESCGVKFA